MSNWTAEALIAFEDDIAARFARAEIPYPVHLDGGNEKGLIEYFDRCFKPGDWVCGTWRMHYKCLLAGVPETEVREAILAGHSITLCFPEYNIIASALVGHICSIATGIALGFKRMKRTKNVHCFVGDMCSYTGAFQESEDYACFNDLPVMFIIEDNKKSVTTYTEEVWGQTYRVGDNTCYINYAPRWPHQGIGKRVDF